ncbi:MAG: Fe-S cluster assembly protein SufD [Gammaproteobacteria bacterium]
MSQAAAIAKGKAALSAAETAFRQDLAGPAVANAAGSALRAAGKAAFLTAGLPAVRDEAWKYTNLRPLARRTFAHGGPVPAPDAAAVESVAIGGLAGPRLVFVNGQYVAALSDPQIQTGLDIVPLTTLIHDAGSELPESLCQLGDPGQHPFTALNQGLLEHGVLLRAHGGAVISDPIYLLFVSVPGAEPQACHPRVFIDSAADSSLGVLEHYVGLGSGHNLTNAVTEIQLQRGSRLRHYRVQDEAATAFHVGGVFASVGRDARLESHNLHFGAALARLDLEVALNEPGAEVEMNGLYCLGGRQHVDNHTRVDHHAPHTRSDEDYRGVLNDRARGVFNGKAIVHQDAQKIEAHQSNSNLLLSEQAEVDTKPELEIYADDVKCSHGATVGQLDQTALFYLRSRGIDEEAAKALLTFAFAEAVVGRVGLEPVRRRLETAVAGALPDRSLIENLIGVDA